MVIIRPIQQSDFSALYEIADESGLGMTSLPLDKKQLQEKIERSINSFAKQVEQPGHESYLFVAEDTATGKVIGTSGIEAAVGLDEAFYHYHLSKVIHSSRQLKVYSEVDILTLCNDYTGASELCTLFLRDGHRQGGTGKLLSKMRFLFLNAHRSRFAQTVIAEMRGVSDEKGNSPFWQWLEKHFFKFDFPTADHMTGIGQKVFIAELMPKYPIYVNLLSEAAQAVIGEVHSKTKPALEMLKKEGFTFNGYVDIFDGGPTVEAQMSNIRTVRDLEQKRVVVGENNGTEQVILSNDKLTDFRATLATLSLDPQSPDIIVPRNMVESLKLEVGDLVSLARI